MQKKIICFFFIFLFSPKVFSERDQSDISLSFGIGLQTYKSLTVESTNTSSASGYKLLFRGGREQQLSMALEKETSSTSFTYRDSSLTSSISTIFQTSSFNYHLGPVYFGLAFAQAQILSSNLSADFLDGISLSQGFAFGLLLPIGKSTTIFFDALSLSPIATKDNVQGVNGAAAFGSRTDLFIGSVFKITKSFLNGRIGYKRRSFAITAAGATKNEEQTMTWIGIETNFF